MQNHKNFSYKFFVWINFSTKSKVYAINEQCIAKYFLQQLNRYTSNYKCLDNVLRINSSCNKFMESLLVRLKG